MSRIAHKHPWVSSPCAGRSRNRVVALRPNTPCWACRPQTTNVATRSRSSWFKTVLVMKTAENRARRLHDGRRESDGRAPHRRDVRPIGSAWASPLTTHGSGKVCSSRRSMKAGRCPQESTRGESEHWVARRCAQSAFQSIATSRSSRETSSTVNVPGGNLPSVHR